MKLKHLITLLIVLLISTSGFSQKSGCKSLHKGTFKIYTQETGSTLIKRSGDTQVEVNTDLGYEIIFDLKWIDECTYELRPRELIKGNPAIMGDGTFVLTTRIKEITTRQYVAETTANFTPEVMSFVVEIVE